MRVIFALFLLIFTACKDEFMLTLNSSEPLSLHYNAKEKALEGLSEPFMLFFYSKDCGVCEKQIPILNELSKEYKIIAVLGGQKDKASAAQNLKGVQFTTVYDRLDVEYLSNVVGGVYGVPAMFIYDARGRLSKRFISLTPKSVLERELRSLQD